MENFWTGACAQRREGVVRKEDFLCTGEFLTGGPKGESWDREGRKQNKMHFSAHKQPKDCGPGQMAGMGTRRNPQKPHSTEGRPG